MGVSGFIVVDASLAVKWLVEEDDSDKAHAALQSWVAQDITRIAPHLMPFRGRQRSPPARVAWRTERRRQHSHDGKAA